MNKYFWFIIILLIFSSCNEESEKPERWVDNVLLSEKDILIAISLDLNSLLSKSDLTNSDQITNQNKMLINAFNSSFKSSLLGFNVDIPQKMFLVSKENDSNGAIFWVGELTNKFIFDQTVKNFFDVDDFSNSDVNTYYLKEYNLYLSFNEFNFVVGFSTDKKYVESKLKSYFNNDHYPENNAAFLSFLENTDDIGFYFSNKRINQLQNSLSKSTLGSLLNNSSVVNQIDHFGDELFTSLNFLNGKVSMNTTTYRSNNSIYNSNGVTSLFKNFVSINELVSFGFANFDLNNEKSFFSNIKVLDKKEDFIAFKFLDDEKSRSTLNGEMSFAIAAIANNQTNDPNFNKSSENFWEDDFDRNIFESDITPPFLVSLGVKEPYLLENQIKEMNKKFELGNTFLMKDYYILLKDYFLHISNKEQLLKDIYSKNKKNYSHFNYQLFQKPMYAEIDLESGLNFMQLKNLKLLYNNIFKRITFTADNDNFSILVNVKNENQNSLKSISDLILKSQLLESYL